jgi:hypothetical protein
MSSDAHDLDTPAGRRRAEWLDRAIAAHLESYAADAPRRALQAEMTAADIADYERRDQRRAERLTEAYAALTAGADDDE